MSDNLAGGRLAAEHLLSLGHRRLGMITVPDDDPAAAERIAGARQAVHAAGADGALLVVERCESNVASGAAAAGRLLQAHPDVTGILCYNDVVAFGVLRAVRAGGRSVPEDVSVVGFDDIAFARFAEPSLTTIAQDVPGLADWAVDRLLGVLAAGPTITGLHQLTFRLPVRLVVRSTTAPAPPPVRHHAPRPRSSGIRS